jgi:hypothetical protein
MPVKSHHVTGNATASATRCQRSCDPQMEMNHVPAIRILPQGHRPRCYSSSAIHSAAIANIHLT